MSIPMEHQQQESVLTAKHDVAGNICIVNTHIHFVLRIVFGTFPDKNTDFGGRFPDRFLIVFSFWFSKGKH